MVTPATPNRRVKRSPAKPPRVDLIPEEFDFLVEDQGIRVRITPSMLCPNRDEPASTNHVLDCSVCHGDEVVDLDDKCFEDWAFMQAIKFDRVFESQIWDVKDAQLSFRSTTRIFYWYKVEILDHASVWNQIIARGSGDLDETRYEPARSCDTDFHLKDANNIYYEKGTHYKIDGKNIRWLTSTRPTAGVLYSLIYPILPTFRVLEVLHDNRYYYVSSKRKDRMPVNLPQQAVVRWDYLANKSGSRELVEPELAP